MQYSQLPLIGCTLIGHHCHQTQTVKLSRNGIPGLYGTVFYLCNRITLLSNYEYDSEILGTKVQNALKNWKRLGAHSMRVDIL